MPVTDSPPQQRAVRHRHLEFQAARPAHARRLRRHGRRHVDADRAGRPPHPLAGARERAEEFHRASTSPIRASPRWSCQTDLPQATCAPTRWRPAATSWRSPTRPRRRACSRPAWSCSTSPSRRSRGRSRSSTARARIRAACTSSGSATANTSTWRRARRTSSRRIRTTTSSTAASTCAIRRSRSRSAAGGMPGTKQGDNVAAAAAPSRSTRATARTTATSIRSGRTAATSPTSTAACTSSTSPTRRTRRGSRRWTNSPPYTGFMHTVVPLFDRGLMLVTDESTENNAKDWPKLVWILDARDETNLVPISTCPLPDHKAYARARPVRRPQHPRERAAADLLAVRPDRARHLLQRRPARLRHLQSVPAAGGRDLRAAGAGRRADRHDPDQRRVRRRARDRLQRRPPIGGLYCLEMDF